MAPHRLPMVLGARAICPDARLLATQLAPTVGSHQTALAVKDDGLWFEVVPPVIQPYE
ncbi:hypothetical protein F9C11_40920 [Amycolatopsis sp. VS8301801F10]|uniref:hypothetical protein n=1 Tax=Amycolatopsis sp. VS8301801F10 TaxID=2652442 RepID=UPI0038FC2A04